MTKVFIDGSAGTAGLRIHSRLAGRSDLELITLTGEARKDPAARKDALNTCDLAVLCLPDAASRESVSMIENPDVRVVDTSTAHRVAPGWAYGFPELSKERREAIIHGKRVASPGCHAGGFIVLAQPLVEAGIIPKDALLSCHSLTGYSGGGKGMIAEYEAAERNPALDSPREYGIAQVHKHLPEMAGISGLEHYPVFCPIVADFYSGMLVTVPLFKQQLNPGYTIDDVRACYAAKYNGPVVNYVEAMDEGGFIASNTLTGTDAMRVTVCGNEERMILCSLFDNLGKGASGAAVQCINLMLGVDETTGLVL